MKNLLLFVLTFLTFTLSAQREIKRDTMYIETIGNQKFIVSYREFTDGTIVSRLPGNFFRLPATDTTEIINFFGQQYISVSDEYSSQVVSIPKLGQTNSTLNSFNTTLTQLFGINLQNAVRDLFKPELLTFRDTSQVYNWTLVTGQTPQAVEFVETGAQKVLRLKLANGTLLPVVVNSGRWFRVLNLDGSNREFHRIENPESPGQVLYAVFNENGQLLYRLRRRN